MNYNIFSSISLLFYSSVYLLQTNVMLCGSPGLAVKGGDSYSSGREF